MLIILLKKKSLCNVWNRIRKTISSYVVKTFQLARSRWPTKVPQCTAQYHSEGGGYSSAAGANFFKSSSTLRKILGNLKSFLANIFITLLRYSMVQFAMLPRLNQDTDKMTILNPFNVILTDQSIRHMTTDS